MNARHALTALSVAATALALPALAPASASPPVPTRALHKALADFARAHPSFPGVAASVRTPRGAWSGAVGVASRRTRTPLTASTGLRIASVTKTFTAAATLRLVEEGRVSLDAPIATYLDPTIVALLKRDGYDTDAIHVRHLLQHTSGLYDYASDSDYQAAVVGSPKHRWTREEQVGFAMNHGAPLFAPGTNFSYSDTGYVLLGQIIERVTGTGLADAYRTLLRFGSLGLSATYLETLERRPAHLSARAHQYLGRIDSWAFDPSFDLYGGGGLVSTVGDLTRFYRALAGGRVLEPKTIATMLGRPDARTPDALGMGIFGEQVAGETCWSHSGFWGTQVAHCPRSGVTIAITVNQAEGFDRPVQKLEATLLRLVR